MKRALVLACLLAALGASLADPAVGGGAATTATERLGLLDQGVLAAVNRTRSERGLRPFVLSKELQSAARSHSRSMLEQGFFAHESAGGASFSKRIRAFYRSAGYMSWSVGENLLSSSSDVSAQAAIDAWLASPGHRENMLSPAWREVGIGALRTRSAGGEFGGKPTWVITMDFGVRSGKPGSTQPAASSATGARVLAVKAPVAQRPKLKRPGKRKAQGVTRVLPGGRTSLPL